MRKNGILCPSLTSPELGANTASMRIVDGETVSTAVAHLLREILVDPPTLRDSCFSEGAAPGVEAEVAAILDENLRIARTERRPLCQDCGIVHAWVRKGRFLTVTGASSVEALINEGIRRAYRGSNFRPSLVASPFNRVNTGDNTPAVVHYEEGDDAALFITLLAKGGGSENVSRSAMLPPSAGRAGIAEFVISVLRDAGGAGCPPYVVGVGVGGSFSSVALRAEEALLFDRDDDPELRILIMDRLSELGYGILGFPGVKPVMAVRVRKEATHISMLPVAVLLNCHSFRRGSITL